MQARSDEDELDILSVLGTIWRGRLLIAVFGLLFVLVGGYYAFRIAVPKYVATSTMALQLRTEPVVNIDSILSGVSTEAAAINTELEVIRSRGLLEKLVRALELQKDPEFNPALRPPATLSMRNLRIQLSALFSGGDPAAGAITQDETAIIRTVDTVRQAISAYNQKSTYVFILQARTTSPKKSATLVNTLADLYIQDQIDVKFQATENAVAWLSERVTTLEAELEERENAIKALQARMDIGSVEAVEAMSQRIRDMRDRRSATEDELAMLDVRLEQGKSLLASADIDGLNAAFEDAILRRLFSQARDGDEAARTSFLARAEALVEQLRVRRERSGQQLEVVGNGLADLERQFEQQSQQIIQLQQMQRDVDATRTLYETFLTRLKETSVQRGLQQADSRVLSVAPPGLYVEPRKSRILLVSLILGILVGAVISLGRQFLYTGVRTVSELEQASGFSVLGQVPQMPIKVRKDLLPFLAANPSSAAVESVRNLRTSVMLANVAHPPQMILSTSGMPGDGKTTLALAMTHNLAGLGKRVLLVDCDIRRRTFNEYFDLSGKIIGWNRILTQDCALEDAVIHDPEIGADIMIAEESRMNAADVFSSDAFRQLLLVLRERYDYIVLDTPPLLVVPDSRIIAPLVDHILVSVAWNKTPRRVISEVVRLLSSADRGKIGFVLSQVSRKGMRNYGYGDSYGAYSSYGKSYYDK